MWHLREHPWPRLIPGAHLGSLGGALAHPRHLQDGGHLVAPRQDSSLLVVAVDLPFI